MSLSSSLARLLEALSRHGVLLTQDPVLPSVVGIVTGEAVRGSWWAHPKSHLIFDVLSELADHPDVQLAKLVARKDTLVHRRLWPALARIGSARAPWQLEGLSAAAGDLLVRLSREREVRAAGAPAKELACRLLVATAQIHTESGKHALALESWASWARRVGCAATRSLPGAQRILEAAAASVGAKPSALPWTRTTGR